MGGSGSIGSGSIGTGAAARGARLAAAFALAPLLLGACSLWPFGGGEEEAETSIEGRRVSVLELEQRLEADPRIQDLPVSLPAERPNVDWAKPGGSATNALHHLQLSAEPKKLWSVGTGAGGDVRLTSTPIVAENKIFILDTEARLRVFEAETGDRLWDADLALEDEDESAGFGGGVAYEAGRVFVTTGFGEVVALEAGSGTELWRRNLHLPIRAAPTVSKGRVFAVTYDNRMYTLSTEDGSVMWDFRGIEEAAGVLASTSPAVGEDVVVAPFSSGEIYAFRVENGRSTWSDSLTRTGRLTGLAALSDIAGRPVIADGRIYAVSHSGRFVSIDLRTGERIWTRNIGGVQTPWVAGEFVFLVSTESDLVAFSRRDGRVRWVAKLPRWKDPDDQDGAIYWSGPVLAGGRLYVASSDEQMLAVSPQDGTVLEEFDLDAPVFVAPVVANGTLYVLSDSGRLTAFR